MAVFLLQGLNSVKMLTVGEDLDHREIQIVGNNQNGIATLENSSAVSYQAVCLLHSTAILKYLLREK